MSELDSVQFGDTAIEYEVRRSRRRKKTVEIGIDGEVVYAVAPSTLSSSKIRELVLKRAGWILRRQDAETPDQPQPKRFVSGETLPYLGRNVRIIVTPADIDVPELRFDHWRFRISVPRDMEDEDRRRSIRRVVESWYRGRAEARLPEYVDRWWNRLGKGERSPILIRDQKRRWGSCATDGTLRFNWRLMMLQPALIEYVVVHELAHLTHMNHSNDYWTFVNHAMPDANRRRQRLREAGRQLPL